ITGTNPNVLVDKTKFAGERLEIIQTKIGTEKKASNDQEFNTSPELTSFDDVTREIKLEDLSKLVKNVVIETMNLDSLEDDQPFIVQDDEDEEVHVEAHAESEGTLVSQTPPSPKTIKIRKLSTQLLLLQSQNLKLEEKKADFKAKVALLSTQSSFPNVEQITELLVKSLKPKLTKLLIDHDFSASIPTEMKELSSKFKEISEEIKDLNKYVEGLQIKISGDLKEILKKLGAFHSAISCLTKQVVELKNHKLEVLASLLALPGQVSSITAYPPKTIPQSERDLVTKSKEDKGNKTLSHEEKVAGQESESDSNAEIILPGFMVKSSKQKHLKKIAYVNEQGESFLMTEEEIKNQKKVEQDIKVDL
nr:hypothetical protein [Tanacetum cinerariifolium]